MTQYPIRHVRRTSAPGRSPQHRAEDPAVLRARTAEEREADAVADRDWRRKARWHCAAFVVAWLLILAAIWLVSVPYTW